MKKESAEQMKKAGRPAAPVVSVDVVGSNGATQNVFSLSATGNEVLWDAATYTVTVLHPTEVRADETAGPVLVESPSADPGEVVEKPKKCKKHKLIHKPGSKAAENCPG